MTDSKRPFAFWLIVIFLAISIILTIAGQTTSVFNYDLAVKLGLQESVVEISELGVQVNRAFGAADTIIYIPLMIVSLIGLIFKKSWSLVTTGAVVGVSAYWALTVTFMFLFFPGVSGYNFVPSVDYWVFVSLYIVFGIWGFFYLLFRGENLL